LATPQIWITDVNGANDT